MKSFVRSTLVLYQIQVPSGLDILVGILLNYFSFYQILVPIGIVRVVGLIQLTK